MTKRQDKQWHHYLESIKMHGYRLNLLCVYTTWSEEKERTFHNIATRVINTYGFGFTISSAGCQQYSTDYIVRINDTPHKYEWVHDTIGGTQKVELTDDMISEAKATGIRDPGGW